MTTFSQSLKLELIGDGQQSGTWGQTTNKNLGTLLEQAITGVISITMLDTNYTLTSFNGVSDEARNAVIVVAGTNSAQRDIIAPLVNKIYTISNNTVGGYAIRIRGASGSAITIPNGVTTSVYCNGSDFYNMQVGTVGNETINGNLTVTGTANIAGATTLASSLSGTTATFSGAISSFSPSFTGVPTAPTAPNGTNTGQIATTAFVASTIATLGTMATQNANNVNITGGNIGASVSWAAMPAGTRLMFAQSAAPTGWTQVTGDEANNRMLRVVNTAGGGIGGSSDPTLMNVVPSHTHGVSGNTGGQSADHSHYVGGATGTMNTNWGHTHTVNDPGHSHGWNYQPMVGTSPGGGSYAVGSGSTQNVSTQGTNISLNYTDINHVHGVGIQSGGVSANHSHYFAVDTNANTGAANWTPRYIDTIICSKN